MGGVFLGFLLILQIIIYFFEHKKIIMKKFIIHDIINNKFTSLPNKCKTQMTSTHC